MSLRPLLLATLLLLGLGGCATTDGGGGGPAGDGSVAVGDGSMSPELDLMANLRAVPDFSTLTSLLDASGLAATLQGEGPYALFAPTDAAFAMLPAGALDKLTDPANRDALVRLLDYHLVEARLDTRAIIGAMELSQGRATVTTLADAPIVVQGRDADHLALVDVQGNVAEVTQHDVMQANGVLHVIDAVLQP